MRNSTIKLRERLKIAGGNPPPVSNTLFDEFIDDLIYGGSFQFIVCVFLLQNCNCRSAHWELKRMIACVISHPKGISM